MGKGGKVEGASSPNQSYEQSTSRQSIENNAATNLTFYTWSQVKESQKWFVINGFVYDVSKFSKKHPGGERRMMNHVGQDATDAFNAFHTNMKKVKAYMKTIEIGRLAPDSQTLTCEEDQVKLEIENEFRKLKSLTENMNLYKSNPIFYILHFAQLFVFELIAWYLLYAFPNSWLFYFFAVFWLVCTQAQAGWLQHDFGHLSVFKSNTLNHLTQKFIIATMKGVSADWWNYRHFQHHAKPNTIKKDPDIRFGTLFVLGKIIPRELGNKKVGKLPYNLQQNYFFLVMPPLLLPLYFNFENIYFLYKKKHLTESLWIASFFIRWFLMFAPLLGFFGALKLYLVVRFFESHWFVWCTQMSHLPMHIDRDYEIGWFRSQLQATCNVEQSFFNDWFSGHLNFQIEHHLFPTMPRHSYHKIAPYVQSMCKKYGIEYQNKTIYRAMADIYT